MTEEEEFLPNWANYRKGVADGIELAKWLGVKWSPIRTAPKDGKDYLIYCSESGEQFVAFYKKDARKWQFAQGPQVIKNPTHWMSLPDGPDEH